MKFNWWANINAGQTKDYGAIEVHGYSTHCWIKKKNGKVSAECFMLAIFIFSYFDTASMLYTRQRANMFLQELKMPDPSNSSKAKQ